MEAPNEIPVRNHVSRRLSHLREISPVSFAYERFFYILQRFSPERIFVSSRIDIQNRFDDRQERKAASFVFAPLYSGYEIPGESNVPVQVVV